MLHALIRPPLAPVLRAGVGSASSSDPYGRTFFADAASGLNRLSYTRSGAIYLPQADGSLLSVASDVLGREWLPALGRYGWRVDPGWTQSLLRSHALDGAGWTAGGTVTFPTDTTPHGSMTVAQIAPGGSIRQSITKSAAAQTWNGLFLLRGSDTSCQITVDDGALTNRGRVVANLAAGAITNTANDGDFTGTVSSITALSNDYHLISLTTTTNAGTTLRWRVAPTGEAFAAAGNLSQAAYAVPLSLSTSAAVTIGAPSWTATLAALGVTLGSEYTLGVEYVAAPMVGTPPIRTALQLDNASSAERAMLRYNNSAGAAWAFIVTGGSTVFGGSATLAEGLLGRHVVRVRAADARSALNGTLNTSPATITMPAGISHVRIGHNAAGSEVFPGHILRAWVQPTVGLADAQLQAVTG